MWVGLFTAFPTAFAALAVALYLPLTAAMTGIVLRGAAFAFRAHGRHAVGRLEPWGAGFGAARVLAPACLAAAAAAVAPPAIRVAGGGGRGVRVSVRGVPTGRTARVGGGGGHPRGAGRAGGAGGVLVRGPGAAGRGRALVPRALTIDGTAAPAATLSLFLVVVAVG